jgi:ketosteroid isomerase-like protein
MVSALIVLMGCGARRAMDPAVQAADLRAVSDAYTRSPASRSASAVVQFFDSAVIVMSPQGRSPVHGLEANRAAWERFFRGGNPVHTMTTDTVVVAASGDLGYTRGHWTVGVDTPTGRAEVAGEYLVVWRRRTGVWRIVVVSAYPFR